MPVTSTKLFGGRSSKQISKFKGVRRGRSRLGQAGTPSMKTSKLKFSAGTSRTAKPFKKPAPPPPPPPPPTSSVNPRFNKNEGARTGDLMPRRQKPSEAVNVVPPKKGMLKKLFGRRRMRPAKYS